VAPEDIDELNDAELAAGFEEPSEDISITCNAMNYVGMKSVPLAPVTRHSAEKAMTHDLADALVTELNDRIAKL